MARVEEFCGLEPGEGTVDFIKKENVNVTKAAIIVSTTAKMLNTLDSTNDAYDTIRNIIFSSEPSPDIEPNPDIEPSPDFEFEDSGLIVLFTDTDTFKDTLNNEDSLTIQLV